MKRAAGLVSCDHYWAWHDTCVGVSSSYGAGGRGGTLVYGGRGFRNWSIALPMLRRQGHAVGGIHRGLSNTVTLRQKGVARTFCEVGKGKIASSVKGLEGAGRFLDFALGHAGAKGGKFGEDLTRSLEALDFWFRGGEGGRRGGGGSGGGDGGSWGEGNMGPDANSTVERLGFVEEQEDGQVRESYGSSSKNLSALSSLDAGRNYVCSGLEIIHVEGMELDEDFSAYEILGFEADRKYSKWEILEAKSRLLATGWYKNVDMLWEADSKDAIKLVVLTEDAIYSKVSSFQCVNVSSQLKKAVCSQSNYLSSEFSPPCILPDSVQRDINMLLQSEEKPSRQTLNVIQNKIESWYRNQGYVFAKVKGFRTSEPGVLECHVDDGIITQISMSCEDEMAQSVACLTNEDIILENLPKAVRQGMPFNSEAGKAALTRIEQLGVFDKVNILATSDSDCGDREGIAVHILVKESPRQSTEVSTEWSFLCNDAGRPDLWTLQPGGSLCVHHRNINGLSRTVSGSISTSNLLRPQDDLGFKLEYIHPLVKGLQSVHPQLEGYKKHNKHTLRLLAFNKRKLSATYYNADHFKEVPAIWIDRAGIKASIVEKLSGQSKLDYGVVIEEVATRDSIGTVCKSKGSSGFSSSLESSGIEHIAFLQMKITRSNLKSGNTGLLGARDLFQLDQGVGLGTRAPMFNRHLLAMTRYIPLHRKAEQEDEIPFVVVLHTRYGGCLGDVVNYRSFSNGGPYALRGHNTGELSSFSRFIEVAGEVRFPVPQRLEGYAFLDTLTSLQNFGAIRNDPASLLERIGKGLMYGAGLKVGNLRIEYVIDNADQTGSLKVYTGCYYMPAHQPHWQFATQLRTLDHMIQQNRGQDPHLLFVRSI